MPHGDKLYAPILSKSIESAILFVSTEIAFSNATFFTILLHSTAFLLASASFGRTDAT